MEQPQRFALLDEASRQAALQAFQNDGAVIISQWQGGNNNTNDINSTSNTCSSWKERAEQLPIALFSKSHLLLEQHEAAAVHVEHKPMGLDGMALPPHTDGYLWGDAYPDVVILVCEQSSESGGENFLIDGEQVMKRLQTNAETIQLLQTIPVDHTERDKETGKPQGVVSVVPVVRYREYNNNNKRKEDPKSSSQPPSWYSSQRRRLCWRRMVETKMDPDRSLWQVVVPQDEETDKEEPKRRRRIQEALWELDRAIQAEAAVAPRFQLAQGEGLIVDNFRMLHAREGFPTTTTTTTSTSNGSTATKEAPRQRRLWRVWSWTTASMGLPKEMMNKSGSSKNDGGTGGQPVAANVMEAVAAIQASNNNNNN